MRINTILIILLFLMLITQPTAGQETTGNTAKSQAPQILTTDLTYKQISKTRTKSVSFVIIDDDNINQIFINDNPVAFSPAKSVVINRKFVFNPGKTIIKVVAIDAAGNQREKTFLVGFGLKEGVQLAPAEEKKPELFIKTVFGVSLENDDNPSNDLSLPISVGDLEITGVIPDGEQPDQRSNLKGTLILVYKNLSGFVGATRTNYSKPENEYLSSQAIYLGAGYTSPLSSSRKLVLNFIMMDINVGGDSYSQNIGLSPGLQFNSKDTGGSYKHLLGIDYTIKNFAASGISAGSQMIAKWVYDSQDAEKLDSYHRTFAYGTNDNGTAASKSTFFNFDYDWQNRWTSGLKWDLGFGIQHKTYINDVPLSSDTPLGSKRVDMPIRVSTGMGWHITNDWNLMYNYKYTFNLSNKTPYVRSVHGLTFNGAF
ncbi:MAG: hypothetical protein HN580_24020 [Deltaproteobacteria bacterium]|nr:hypothetical protein [Deltaproteobacteria bacterium]MBT4265182.1 hypothetical protein [Deltaproteobacteria bacterium]MBT4638627.1 hypothetical protein [Deltaproteobacteria bacterium]MBT6503510.1 hypothetical protein [Deltaproteobacteria bacterium]MBT6611614.1 hypothetical protein [Deltaproteobacteria bacterium]